MKPVIVAIGVLALGLGLGVTAFSKGSGTGYVSWTRSPARPKVRIDYTKHQAKGVKCNDCHVLHKDGKRHLSNCATCHAKDAKAVGHKLCIGCHRAKGGPKACSGCHKG